MDRVHSSKRQWDDTVRLAPKRILAVSAVQLVYTIAVLYVAISMPFFAYALPFSDLLLLDVILGNPPINRKWPLMLFGGADLIVTFFTFGTPGAIIIANGVFEIGWFLASFAGPLIGLILFGFAMSEGFEQADREKKQRKTGRKLIYGNVAFYSIPIAAVMTVVAMVFGYISFCSGHPITYLYMVFIIIPSIILFIFTAYIARKRGYPKLGIMASGVFTVVVYSLAMFLFIFILGSIGVFSCPFESAVACISSAGYICSSPNFNNGNFTATLGQSSDLQWPNATFFFVQSGMQRPLSLPNISNCSAILATPKGISLASGETRLFTFPLSSACNTIQTVPGTYVSGFIYATNSTGEFPQQVASVTLRES